MVKVKISEIKANPFKRFINDGELDSDRVDKLVESIEHGTLPAQFVARKNEAGDWEQTSGHHRLAAFKKKYGKDFEVDVTPVKFSDELMLVDMVRENITQRESDFRDTESSVVLTRTWLDSGALTVKQLNSEIKKGGIHKNGLHGTEPSPDSFRSIATFLSKNGNTISHTTVKKYLDIHDKLDPELHKKVTNIGWTKMTKENKEEHIGQEIAAAIATIPKKEQKQVLEQIKELRYHVASPIITAYKNSSENIKQMFREGKIKPEQMKAVIPEIISRQEEYDEEPDQTEKQILFETKWEQDQSSYINDLILWKKFPRAKWSKADYTYYLKQLRNSIEYETELIETLEDEVKKI